MAQAIPSSLPSFVGRTIQAENTSSSHYDASIRPECSLPQTDSALQASASQHECVVPKGHPREVELVEGDDTVQSVVLFVTAVVSLVCLYRLG